ncbi:MAG: SUF system NifU family Fe-S cluster assembly protein [Patescibacteria group bacterium]|jgi:nitrogen fixation NifU-like protein
MNIYQDIILDHYHHPHNKGKISHPSNSVLTNNPLCGDKIEMMVVYDRDKVKEIKFHGEGCVISQASASMLTDYAKNKSKHELKKLDSKFIIKMIGIDLGMNRIKCAVLPLEALQKLLI